MTTAEIISRPIATEHVRITSRRSFQQVGTPFEADLPKLDPSITVLLSVSDQEGIGKYERTRIQALHVS